MLAIYIVLKKKLLVDIVNQNKLPNIIVSAVASSYFNRVAHLIAGKYFGLFLDFVIIFFTTIQGIEIYLLILFGISQTFYTSNKLAF